ncbi:MAG: hypothetical protein IKE95_08820 [Methanobrevibacter sp.]|nr:hypothetical protein [Methanobrevibacter sp.]
MKNVTKMLFVFSFSCLLISTVSAFDVDSLKPINDYNSFQDGCSTYRTNNKLCFSVEKMYGDYSGYFLNETELTVTPVGDNIYRIEDTAFEIYGYQEVVMIDGNAYLVCLLQESKMSPGETNLYLQNMKDFNSKNNLEPIAV